MATNLNKGFRVLQAAESLSGILQLCLRSRHAAIELQKRDSVTGRGDAGARRPRNADAPLNLAFLIQLSPQVEAVPEGLGAAGSH
ncbi:hypothetical protein MHYP_G00190420 [Metynnis hypsauchen]